jgi:hypothetical protein
LEGNLLKLALYRDLPHAKSSAATCSIKEKFLRSPSFSAQPIKETFFWQSFTMDGFQLPGKYSNMCTFVCLIAINIYIVLISRLYDIFI